jgi:hypothetical protein
LYADGLDLGLREISLVCLLRLLAFVQDEALREEVISALNASRASYEVSARTGKKDAVAESYARRCGQFVEIAGDWEGLRVVARVDDDVSVSVSIVCCCWFGSGY